MTSDIVNVVIDERKRMDAFDASALLKMTERYIAGQSQRQRVFKDYIISSEVFYVDTSL